MQDRRLNPPYRGAKPLRVFPQIPIEKNGFYVMDRSYFNVKFFEKLRRNEAFFLTRTKNNIKYKVLTTKKSAVIMI